MPRRSSSCGGRAAVGGLSLCVLMAACASRRTVGIASDGAPAAAADSGSSAVVPDGPAPLPACAMLRGQLGAGARLSPLRATHAAVAADLARVALLAAAGEWSTTLQFVELPSLAVTTFELAGRPGWRAPELVLDGAGVLVYTVLPEGERLSLQRLDGALHAIADAPCLHLVTPDRRHALVLERCGSGTGTLRTWDLERVAGRTLGEGVYSGSVSLAPSGHRATAVVARDATPDCWSSAGALMLHELAGGGPRELAQDVMADTVEHPRDDLILWQRLVGCDEQGPRTELNALAGGTQRALGSRCCLGPPFGRYRVSPQGDWVLGAGGGGLFEEPSALYAIATDGSGERLLADDVLLQHPLMSAITPFPPLTADGRFAIYQQHDDEAMWASGWVPLRAVRVDDGTRVPLAAQSSLMGVQVAPRGSRVLLVEHEGGADAPMVDQLIVADLDTAARAELARGLGLQQAAFLPDGRGVIFLDREQPRAATALRVCAPAGTCQELGRFAASELSGGFQLAPDGCFAVYDTDLGEAPGTRLALID